MLWLEKELELERPLEFELVERWYFYVSEELDWALELVHHLPTRYRFARRAE